MGVGTHLGRVSWGIVGGWGEATPLLHVLGADWGEVRGGVVVVGESGSGEKARGKAVGVSVHRAHVPGVTAVWDVHCGPLLYCGMSQTSNDVSFLSQVSPDSELYPIGMVWCRLHVSFLF